MESFKYDHSNMIIYDTPVFAFVIAEREYICKCNKVIKSNEIIFAIKEIVITPWCMKCVAKYLKNKTGTKLELDIKKAYRIIQLMQVKES